MPHHRMLRNGRGNKLVEESKGQEPNIVVQPPSGKATP